MIKVCTNTQFLLEVSVGILAVNSEYSCLRLVDAEAPLHHPACSVCRFVLDSLQKVWFTSLFGVRCRCRLVLHFYVRGVSVRHSAEAWSQINAGLNSSSVYTFHYLKRTSEHWTIRVRLQACLVELLLSPDSPAGHSVICCLCFSFHQSLLFSQERLMSLCLLDLHLVVIPLLSSHLSALSLASPAWFFIRHICSPAVCFLLHPPVIVFPLLHAVIHVLSPPPSSHSPPNLFISAFLIALAWICPLISTFFFLQSLSGASLDFL